MKIEFPNYSSDSSIFVRMYLDGKFGKDPKAVDPYIASPMFTLDRDCSFLDIWGDFYNAEGLVVADRYTTSNMVHQASKIADPDQRDRFLDWLWDFEYGIYKLRCPTWWFFWRASGGKPKALQKRPLGGRRIYTRRTSEYLEKTI